MDENLKEENLYNKLYRDIIYGYSQFSHEGNDVYIKHISQTDFGYIEEFENRQKLKAQRKGLPSENEKIEELIRQKLWTKEKEQKKTELEKEIENLEISVSKLIIASQIKQMRSRIGDLEGELSSLLTERAESVGLTSDSYATRKSNLEILRWTLYKDTLLKDLLFSPSDFDFVDDEELNELLAKNNKIVADFRQKNLKKISASGFFLNSFLIADGNVMSFYGKPVVSLTNYQIEIFNHGLRYKSVLEKGKTPPSVLENIDQIVDWYEGQLSEKTKGIEETKNKTGQSVVGATREEMKQMIETSKEDGEEVAEFGAEAKKLMDKEGKKTLDFNDILKIHGEI